jgi:hypothetical protein
VLNNRGRLEAAVKLVAGQASVERLKLRADKSAAGLGSLAHLPHGFLQREEGDEIWKLVKLCLSWMKLWLAAIALYRRALRLTAAQPNL